MYRILLAEDDQIMREYLTRALERSGYAVTAVDRGTAAIPLLQTERFDLLLTDLRMPRLDGKELIARLRAERPDLPVVVMTGFPPPEGAIVLQAGRGPMRLLTKPIGINPLVAALRAVKAGDSVTTSVGALTLTSLARCNLFGLIC